MKLIKEIESKRNEKGKLKKWGEFLCPLCLQIIERQLDNGKKQRSCGCLPKNYKYGISKTKLYRVWIDIKTRCLNTNSESYKDYGGRGITICPEWTNDYTKFRDWSLDNGYQEGLQINRINNDGNYEPNNCNFVTAKENARNRRLIEVKLSIGIRNEIRELYIMEGWTQKELAKKYNISQATVSLIINSKRWIK